MASLGAGRGAWLAPAVQSSLSSPGHVAAQFLLLGLLLALSTVIVFSSVAILGGAISGYLARSPSSYAALQYISAGVMLLLAAWIAARTLRS